MPPGGPWPPAGPGSGPAAPPPAGGGSNTGKIVAIVLGAIIVVGGAVFIGTQLGSDDGVQPYAEAMMPLLSDFDAVDESAAECISTRFVDDLGVDRLEREGISPDDLGGGNPDGFFTVSDGELFVSALKECDVSPRDYFLGGFIAGSGDRVACLDEALSDDDIEVALAHAIPGDEPPSDVADIFINECPTDD